MIKHGPDKIQLSQMVGHVAYEFAAMTVMCDRFKSGGNVSVPEFESFLVHARNLYGFLFRHRGDADVHPRDVLAEDYLPAWDDPAMRAKLGQAYRNMHTQLAHLSVDRVNEKSRYSWNRWKDKYQSIHDELSESWNRFLSQLTPGVRTAFSISMNNERQRLMGEED